MITPIRRAVFAVTFVLLLAVGTPAGSQALPPEAAAAIEAALREGERARANAAVMSAVMHDADGRRALDNAARRATEAALSGAVVTSIAAYPGAARAIVAAAVAAAPDHRDAILARASAAFPGFFAAHAGTAGVSQLAGPAPAAVPPAPRAIPAASQPTMVDTAAPDGDGEAAGRRDPFVFDLGYIESYPLNAARLFASPWRFDRSDWINTAVVLGIGGGLMALDTSIRDFIQGDVRGGATNDFSDLFREFGDTQILAIGLGATYVGAEIIGDGQLQETALLAEESLLLASVLGLGIKWATQRDRPGSGKGAASWDPFSFDETNTSFVSGHAINAFTVASVIASQYGDSALIGPAAYGVATATAFSRLNENRHWASDVFVGAAIGYFVGKMVVRHNPFDPARGVAIQPWGDADSRGLSLAVDF